LVEEENSTSTDDISESTHNEEEMKDEKVGGIGVDNKDLNVLHIDGIQAGVCSEHTTSSTKLVDVGGGVDGLKHYFHSPLTPNESPPKVEATGVVESWLREAHGSHKGHMGYEATVRNLFDLKSFRGAALRGGIPKEMECYIKQWLRQCDACQKMSVRRTVIQAEHFTCSTYRPMQCVAIDYIEKLTPDRWGNDMIIVIIDFFSRFVVLYAVQSTRAKIFVDTFIKWIALFGEPEEVLSDQGSQFLSNLVQGFYEATNTKCIITTPNSKQ